jgi:hypothetical protein
MELSSTVPMVPRGTDDPQHWRDRAAQLRSLTYQECREFALGASSRYRRKLCDRQTAILQAWLDDATSTTRGVIEEAFKRRHDERYDPDLTGSIAQTSCSRSFVSSSAAVVMDAKPSTSFRMGGCTFLTCPTKNIAFA